MGGGVLFSLSPLALSCLPLRGVGTLAISVEYESDSTSGVWLPNQRKSAVPFYFGTSVSGIH